MNIDNIDDKERLRICRIYYLAGFAFLPFLWIVNFFWFFKQVFMRKPYPEQAQMKKYLVHSGIGSIVWLCLIVAWNIVFHIHRVEWDAIGDQLTFVIPRGKA